MNENNKTFVMLLNATNKPYCILGKILIRLESLSKRLPVLSDNNFQNFNSTKISKISARKIITKTIKIKIVAVNNENNENIKNIFLNRIKILRKELRLEQLNSKE